MGANKAMVVIPISKSRPLGAAWWLVVGDYSRVAKAQYSATSAIIACSLVAGATSAARIIRHLQQGR